MEETSEGCVTKLSCDHMFHTDCIEKWNTMSNTCPVCRTRVTRPFRMETALMYVFPVFTGIFCGVHSAATDVNSEVLAFVSVMLLFVQPALSLLLALTLFLLEIDATSTISSTQIVLPPSSLHVVSTAFFLHRSDGL